MNYRDIWVGFLHDYGIKGEKMGIFQWWSKQFCRNFVLRVHSKITFSIARIVIMIGLFNRAGGCRDGILPLAFWEWKYLLFYHRCEIGRNRCRKVHLFSSDGMNESQRLSM